MEVAEADDGEACTAVGAGAESVGDAEVWSIWTRWDLAGWAFVLYMGKWEPS